MNEWMNEWMNENKINPILWSVNMYILKAFMAASFQLQNITSLEESLLGISK
jgi:hypothetical protein